LPPLSPAAAATELLATRCTKTPPFAGTLNISSNCCPIKIPSKPVQNGELSSKIFFAGLIEAAKPMPSNPPDLVSMELTMPITLPSVSKIGPPEFPVLIDASVC